MQQMSDQDEIEFQIWEYIDGIAADAEKQRIAGLIANNTTWRNKYDELTALHTSITTDIEKEEPSMRFAKNVMETIATTKPARAARLFINPMIIRGIAAFFIVIVAAIMIYTFINVHTTSRLFDFSSGLNVVKSTIGQAFNSSLIQVALFVNVVLALLFFDSILRKRRIHQTGHQL